MKSAICFLLTISALAQSALAEMKIPKSVFRYNQVEEAKVKATEAGKPLIFILTDPGTT